MRTRVLAAVGAVVVAVLTPATATATANAGGMTVVAQGLDGPRGLAFAPDGALYVAESGRGGAGPCFPGPEGGEVCFGDSGAITRIAGGAQNRVITGLPSIAAPDGSGAIGPSDVDPFGRGGLYFTVGLGADPAVRAGLPPLGQNASAWLLRGHHDGWRQVADIGTYEAEANPDGGLPDTNPNSVLSVPGGQAVVDAGGNALLLAHHQGISTLAVFDTRTIDGQPVQAVPTSVAHGRDNALYVGELTGFPFPPGQARVHRVQPGRGATVFATGFTNIIDVAFDHRGRLYVLEIAHNGLLSGDPTGALIRVERDGSHTVVASEGLVMPGGLAIRDGAAYVSNCGVCPGGGTVVRIPLG
ncbi:ScyD/ScyE family protein [Actinosynnema sp. NPDC050801]|uniref:ScyD/ScyE family protein n=1 Tax=unclassified Actinosynnema TaxID=2637065 RepID=UPI0033DCA361